MKESPDPGSRSIARFCWLAALVLFATIVAVQQGVFEGSAKNVAHAKGGKVEIQPPSGEVLMLGRIWVKTVRHQKPVKGSFEDQILKMEMDFFANTDADRLRMVPVAGELWGKEEVDARLHALELKLPADSPLRSDLAVLERIYSGERPDRDAPEVKTFLERHTYFAELALSHGLADNDPARAKLITGGEAAIVLMTVGMCIYVLVIGLGFILLIVWSILVLMGRVRLRYVAPTTGGSLGIEIFTVFLGGFALLKVAAALIGLIVTDAKVAHAIVMLLQWSLVLIVLYPKFRGYPLGESWRRLGFHTGTGVFREIGAGVLGYIGSLPLLILGLVGAFILMVIWAAVSQMLGYEPEGASNTLIDMIAKMDWWEMLLLGTLALVWAPIVEEFVFRGGLLRDLSSRVWGIVAAVLTSFFFAFAHGYPIVLLPILMGLATGFAFIRFWRGSIIGCITAHCIHNTFAMTMLYIVSQLLKD